MATVTGLTAERMQEIIDATITDADIVASHLILTLQDGSTIDAGAVGPAGKGNAFPAGATDGDLFVRTDQAGDPLYKFTDGAWSLFVGGGVGKGAAFPTAPAPVDGDMFVRTDLTGDPLYKFTDGVWELQPRMGAVNVPAVKGIGSAALATANNAQTALTFPDAEGFDTDSIHDPAVSSQNFTIKTPGLYYISATVFWAAAGGTRELILNVNNVTESASDANPSSGAFWHTFPGRIVRLAAGDVVRMDAWQNSGGAVNITNRSMSLVWLGGPGQTVDERGVPSTKAFTTAPQSIPHSTQTAVSFGSEIWDSDGLHDTAVNATRFVAKTPGLYLVQMSGDWALTAAGQRRFYFLKNGVGTTEWTHVTIPGSGTAAANRMQAAAVLQLAAGDYVEGAVYQDSGSALTVDVAMSFTMLASGKTVTPFARVYKTASTQTIPADNQDYALSFDAEEADNDGIHDNVTNNTRLTCRTAGIYFIKGLVTQVAGATAGTRWISIRKNGSSSTYPEQVLLETNRNSTLRDSTFAISGVVELAVGDYIELVIANVEGGASITIGGGVFGRGSKFSMVKIGAPISGNTGIDPVEGWHAVSAAGEPALQNAAVLIRPVRFRKDRGVVRFEPGSYIQGPAALALFTLPVGYRPAYDVVMWGVDNTGAQVKLTALADGTVQTAANKSGGGWVDLGNIRFDHA